METIYKLSQLVSVEVRDKFKTPLLIWNIKEKFFEEVGGHSVFTIEDLTGGLWAKRPLLVIDNTAYEMPSVILKFSNNSRYLKRFHSYEYALFWGREIAEAPPEKTLNASKAATN